MNRLFRYLALAVSLTIATPALAQFQGLDLGGKKTKKKKKSGGGSKSNNTDKEDEKDKEEDKGSGEMKLPDTGLDLTQPDTNTNANKNNPPPDLTKDNGKTKQAPAMSFEAVDVSGKTGDRQKLEAALTQFKNENYEQAALSSYELLQDPSLAALHLEARYLL
ncbi:MAG: hypothetical protein ACJ790_21610, partial [Myxococcaceae bacterium]